MKRKLIIFISCFVCLFGAFIACQDDEFNPPWTKPSALNLASFPQEIQEAAQWYEDNNYQLFEVNSKSVTKHPLFEEMEPNWLQSYIRKNDRLLAVEVTLKTKSSILFIHPECVEMFRLTGEGRYRQAITRMVILTDLHTGTTLGFFMSIIPDPEYMEKTNFHPFANTYLERDPGFGGIIVYHDLNGVRANGWVYDEGKIVGRLPRSHKQTTPNTRGYTEVYRCVNLYERECTLWHWVMEAEGEILQDYYELKDCHTHFIGQDCWVERVYVPDTDPGSGSGGGGSGSSGSHGGGNEPDGGYESPVCPDCNHSPCVCVRTGNCDTIHAPLLNSLYAQFKNAGLEEKFIDLYKGEANEWASELYDSAGVVFMTPPHTDGKPSGVSVTLITSDKRKALATIHNHPSGNGPSVVDAMSLAKSFYKSGLKSIYVCAPDGRLYSLTVTQPNAVFTFYRTYSDSIGMEGMKRMLDSYMNMLKEYDGLNYKVQTSSLYALSAVLHVLSSGIEVMEGQMIKGHMEFNIRKGEMVNIETERIIRRSTCY